MEKLNILFLGGSKRVSLAERFVEAGKALKFSTNVYTYELDNKVPFNVIGKVIIGKKWNDNKIYEDLKHLIKNKNISIVLANVDNATIILGNLNKLFPELKLITSTPETCEIFLDKEKMYNHCAEKGIKIIPFSTNNYPIFVKPRKGSASKNTYIVPDSKYKNYLLSNIDENQYIFQKYIEGIEYTVDVYVSKQNGFIGAVPRIRTNISDGESTTAKIIEDDEILSETKNILSKFDLVGPLTLQFIRANGELYFLEINPRFGGGVIASIEAGFNIPEIMIRDYLGEKIKQQSKYNKLIMTRCYREVFHAIDS